MTDLDYRKAYRYHEANPSPESRLLLVQQGCRRGDEHSIAAMNSGLESAIEWATLLLVRPECQCREVCECYGSDYNGGVWDPHEKRDHFTKHEACPRCGDLDWPDRLRVAAYLGDPGARGALYGQVPEWVGPDYTHVRTDFVGRAWEQLDGTRWARGLIDCCLGKKALSHYTILRANVAAARRVNDGVYGTALLLSTNESPVIDRVGRAERDARHRSMLSLISLGIWLDIPTEESWNNWADVDHRVSPWVPTPADLGAQDMVTSQRRIALALSRGRWIREAIRENLLPWLKGTE